MNDPIDPDGHDPTDEVPGWRALGDELAATPGPDPAARARILTAVLDAVADDGGAAVVPLPTRRTPRLVVAAAAVILALAVPAAVILGSRSSDSDSSSDMAMSEQTADLRMAPDESGALESGALESGVGPTAAFPGALPEAESDGFVDPFIGAFDDRSELLAAVAELPSEGPLPEEPSQVCPPPELGTPAAATLRVNADLDGVPVLIERFDELPDAPVVIRTIPDCTPLD